MDPNQKTPSQCERCATPLAQGALVCSACHSLVHSERLKQLTADAQSLESSGDLAHARDHWSAALELLPPDAQQANWIRERIKTLDHDIATRQHPSSNVNPWVKKLGPLAPIVLFLSNAKGLLVLFKFQTLFSFFWYVALYTRLYGAAFGVGFAVQILIHEMGHYVDIRRRGLPADMPVFFPGLGAYVRWRALGVTEETRAQISLAGPMAGLLAASLCYVVWMQTHSPLWAALAHAGAWINLVNLIPVWILDGGSAMKPMSFIQRIAVLTCTALLWYAVGDWAFLMVAAGCAYRLFTKDSPEEGNMGVTVYFVAVMFGLALIMHFVPKGNIEF